MLPALVEGVRLFNGEEFFDEHPGDKGGWSHGRTIYREQVEVPLIIRLPPALPGGNLF